MTSTEDAPLMTEATPDVEAGVEQATETLAAAAAGQESGKNRIVVTDFDTYHGSNLNEKIDSAIDAHAIFIISKSACPFCRDVKDLLADQMGATIHSVEVNEHPDGPKIFAYGKSKAGKSTVPLVFIKGSFVGGCDDLKALHHKGQLQGMLQGLVSRARTAGTDKLETSHLVSVGRSQAMNPLFWFPNTVNNYVIRVVGFQVCALSVLSAAFFQEAWGRWMAVFLLVDFCLRFVAGASASPLGMIATLVTSPFRPQFKPGPSKQFASFCGIMFAGFGTLFYFLSFPYHQWVGMAFMVGLAGAAGLEWALNFCLGCKFFAIGIYLGLIPDYVYRIYTTSKQETEDSWDYMFLDSKAPMPESVDSDPNSKISLKYKKKSDEWSKDDFDFIRHMHIGYFAMPLSLGALAVAFKISSEWADAIGEALGVEERALVAHEGAFQAIACVAALVFIPMLVLYTLRLVMYTHKCTIEWQCPLRGNSFALIPLCFMVFAFLLYDQIEYNDEPTVVNEETPQIAARVLFWLGAVAQVILTVVKFGEWIARRLEMEHVHPHWIIMPVGLSVAALVAPVVPLFAADSDHADGTVYLARFFQSFAVFMFLVLFTVTFFKVATSHNSDTRLRMGIMTWLAAPAILGLSDFVICFYSQSPLDKNECVDSFANWYFISIFIFLGILYSAMPWIGFLGKDKWGMQYWLGCFALDALAAAAAMFYAVTDFNAAQTLSMIGLSMASIANFVNFLHFATGLVRRRGVFVPENKWGPLSFMKLTHEAFRGNMATLRASLEVLDLEKDSDEMRDTINMFAVHLNRFNILHEEHSKHEDEVIFKVFNDWFHDHAKRYNDDHEDFHTIMNNVERIANLLLDRSLPIGQRQEALAAIKKALPPFFESFEEHLKGEEDNLQPIGKKILPLAIQKQISRDVWDLTSADRWEIILPFVINNLPRHVQRVRYIKVLLWSMPERAHQVGGIIYRNVDAVMWERLKEDIPEMIPRGEAGYWRYY